jgi:hypothetical protein
VAEGAATMWELVATGAATVLLPGRPRVGHGEEEWRRLPGADSMAELTARLHPPPPDLAHYRGAAQDASSSLGARSRHGRAARFLTYEDPCGGATSCSRSIAQPRPPSPPPRGRRNQPPEWMHKMMQQAAGTPGLFGEVCFSLFSAEEVFCRCRTTICCGQSYSATFKFHPAASISPVRHRAGVDVESQTQLAAAWVGAQGSSRQAQNQQQAGPSD